MNASRRTPIVRAAALSALAGAVLSIGLAHPVQAQGGAFKKLREKTRVIQERLEKADTALTKAGETAESIECLTNDADCAQPSEPQGAPPAAPSSSGGPFCAPASASTAPREGESGPAPPDTADA